MRDLTKELQNARNKKIYADNEFETLLSTLKSLNSENNVNWDIEAGEEWAFVNNRNMSIMLNAKIGIYFVRGELSEDYLEILREGNCVYISDFDSKEWYVDLECILKNIPEIIWHSSSNDVDIKGFSLDELYFATV